MTTNSIPVHRLSSGMIFKTILSLVVFALIGWLTGCAPLPPLEEEAKTQTTGASPKADAANEQREAEIAKYRSFAYERWKNGEYEAARGHFNKIRVLDIEHKHNIYRQWADCFVRSGMIDSARCAYEEGINYFPDDDYLHNGLAIVLRNAGQMEDAIEQQKEAVRIKPDNEDYLFALAEMYEKTENWEKAVETYEVLADLFPDNPLYNQRIIDIKRIYFNPEEYLQTLKDAVNKFPDDPKRHFDYAMALLDQGHSEQAVGEFEAYTRQQPNDAEGWRNLARARENLSDFRGAVTARKKVIEINPESLKDMVNVGRNYLNLKKWVEARGWAKRALAKDSDYGSAWVLMGDIYFNAADLASGDSPKYNDKLVFTIAYGLYRRAATSSDIEARSDGERGLRILKGGELIPSREERFMNRSKTRPIGDLYKWINPDWPEVGYVDTYLKALD